MRKQPTPAEAALWERLRTKQIGYRFVRQRTILQYVADFYCPSTGLVIEVDGGYHRSSPGLAAYERRRDRELRELALTVLRFTNERVLESIDTVLSEIVAKSEHLGVRRPLSRRFLMINDIQKKGR